jgi:hypothetical protein
VNQADIRDAVIGLRSLIGPNAQIRSSIIMGADYYETEADRAENKRLGRPTSALAKAPLSNVPSSIRTPALVATCTSVASDPTAPDSETDNWVVGTAWLLSLRTR